MILHNWQRPGFLVGMSVLVLSATLHAAGMVVVAPAEDVVQLHAGGQGETAALGSFFADFAAGAVPVTPAAQPAEDAPAQQAVAQKVQQPVAQTASPAPSPEAQQVQPTEASVPPATAQVQAPVETVQATDATPTSAPTTSSRPQARPATQPRQRQQAAPRPAGNSDADLRRGSATGQQAGQSAVAGQTQRPTAASGNAAASNYPGEVLRKITRQRRAPAPRARAARGQGSGGFLDCRIGRAGLGCGGTLVGISGSGSCGP